MCPCLKLIFYLEMEILVDNCTCSKILSIGFKLFSVYPEKTIKTVVTSFGTFLLSVCICSGCWNNKERNPIPIEVNYYILIYLSILFAGFWSHQQLDTNLWDHVVECLCGAIQVYLLGHLSLFFNILVMSS